MKKSNITKQVLLMLLMIICGSLKAQETYKPFPTEKAQWSVANEKYVLPDFFVCQVFLQKILPYYFLSQPNAFSIRGNISVL